MDAKKCDRCGSYFDYNPSEQCMYGYKSLEERIRIVKENKEDKNE